MECKIFIKADFSSVFLLNGTFCEKVDNFNYDCSNPLYITVLPLSAHLLPYTVKILKGKVLNNDTLCACFSNQERLFIKLMPRYNYIYNSSKNETPIGDSITEKLFKAVKNNNLISARKLLTASLNESIDDPALNAFFADYTAIVKDDFTKADLHSNTNSYYLIDSNNNGSLCRFEMRDGLIDNILQD